MSEKSLRKLRIRSENIRILLAELIGTFILIVSKILFLYTAVYFLRIYFYKFEGMYLYS